MVHFIFDSYVDFSMKGTERSSRGSNVKGAIHLAKIGFNTLVPEQMGKFWNSVKNKRLLQELACKVIEQEMKDYSLLCCIEWWC